MKMETMKKLLAALAMTAMMFAFAGCDTQEEAQAPEETTAVTEEAAETTAEAPAASAASM